MTLEAGHVWEKRLWVRPGEFRARVTLLVLSLGPATRVRCLTLESTHEDVWPTGEVIDAWDVDDFREQAERLA